MIGKISGTGSYVPSRYLDNHNLSQIVDTSDEWIQERTGIIRRHIVEADTTVSMAAQAAEKALESAKMLPEEIDLLIVSTISSNVLSAPARRVKCKSRFMQYMRPVLI